MEERPPFRKHSSPSCSCRAAPARDKAGWRPQKAEEMILTTVEKDPCQSPLLCSAPVSVLAFNIASSLTGSHFAEA